MSIWSADSTDRLAASSLEAWLDNNNGNLVLVGIEADLRRFTVKDRDREASV